MRGPIVAIGGAEDKERERRVLFELVRLAGGRAARIAVLPVASGMQPALGETYTRVFMDLGAPEPEVFFFEKREDAVDGARLAKLAQATLVFLTGGDQFRLMERIGGTPVARLISRLNAAGVPVAGTSAGAAALCRDMIVRGQSGMLLGRHVVSLSRGLALTDRLIIDQHFSQRHRLGRLFSAVALNPGLVGAGVDEDTAAVIGPDDRMTVWGRGAVTVVDGRRLTWTDVRRADAAAPAAMLGVTVHVLTSGCSFDLQEHVARAPERAEAAL